MAHTKEYLERYRTENRAALNAKANAYYHANKERLRKYNRDKAREYRKAAGKLTRAEWYLKTGRGITESERKRRRCESSKKWRRAHPDKAKARDHLNNTRRRGFDVRCLSEAVRARLEFYGNTCIYCCSTKNIEVDHIKPLSKGGVSLPCNLAPACEACNRKKHAHWAGPLDWIKRRDYGVSNATILPETAPSPASMRVMI